MPISSEPGHHVPQPHDLGGVPDSEGVDAADAVERLQESPEEQKNATDPSRTDPMKDQ